eukprot:1834730-Prymnesium_polylepis.1
MFRHQFRQAPQHAPDVGALFGTHRAIRMPHGGIALPPAVEAAGEDQIIRMPRILQAFLSSLRYEMAG